jgi:hypothetical protein
LTIRVEGEREVLSEHEVRVCGILVGRVENLSGQAKEGRTVDA